MVYELNGRKNICIFGKVITLQIILKNENQGEMTCSKLQVPKLKYGYQIIKKVPFQKLI